MLAASVREVVGKKEKVVLERSARLELDPKIRVRRNNLKETWVTGEKEEKNEREEKKVHFLDTKSTNPHDYSGPHCIILDTLDSFGPLQTIFVHNCHVDL